MLECELAVRDLCCLHHVHVGLRYFDQVADSRGSVSRTVSSHLHKERSTVYRVRRGHLYQRIVEHWGALSAYQPSRLWQVVETWMHGALSRVAGRRLCFTISALATGETWVRRCKQTPTLHLNDSASQTLRPFGAAASAAFSLN